ncbi:hypothetical protein KIW84_022418 [Lathyrus oleraceus]|uniref:Neutral ceramidase n=1 Tax=Pisum sativum TaxID=3888 RepID=A0A9D5B9X9_PEA|nr:hypothetical protein KIW84_022418 [Pisum sativum]
MKLLYDWAPSIPPIQIFRIGQFSILSVPGEFTTMAGRRLRDAVKTVLSVRGAKIRGCFYAFWSTHFECLHSRIQEARARPHQRSACKIRPATARPPQQANRFTNTCSNDERDVLVDKFVSSSSNQDLQSSSSGETMIKSEKVQDAPSASERPHATEPAKTAHLGLGMSGLERKRRTKLQPPVGKGAGDGSSGSSINQSLETRTDSQNILQTPDASIASKGHLSVSNLLDYINLNHDTNEPVSTAATVAKKTVTVKHSNKTYHGCDDCYLKKTIESTNKIVAFYLEKKESVHPDGSLGNSLGDVNRLLGGGDDHRVAETTVAFISSIVCENTDKISTNLPSGVVISRDLLDDCETENPLAIQSHLNLALLDLEDDAVSISSTEQSVSLEVYLQGRHFFTVISWSVI